MASKGLGPAVQIGNSRTCAACVAILWIVAGQAFWIAAKHAAASTDMDPDLAYLGQTPPGLEPCRFPPDSLLADDTRAWHHGPVFSPSLDEMYWTYFDGVLPAIYAMEVVDGAWGPVHRPSFASLDYGETCPMFSAGGDSLYFLSDRPERGIYLVIRVAGDWSAPVRIEVPNPDGVWLGWQFSVARDATIYYELRDEVGLDILVTRPVAGQYQTSERLGGGVNSLSHDFAPYVHPDEDYILFNSNRAGGYGFNDVYVSFSVGPGEWAAPQNLGPDINTWFEDAHPVVTPDGHFFFFTTQRAGDLGYNPYWVDSAVIEALRPVSAVDDPAAMYTRDISLGACSPNPFNPATAIPFFLDRPATVNLRIFDPAGRLVRTLLDNAACESGSHQVRWHGRDDSGRNVPSGIYLYRLDTDVHSATRKLVLAR